MPTKRDLEDIIAGLEKTNEVLSEAVKGFENTIRSRNEERAELTADLNRKDKAIGDAMKRMELLRDEASEAREAYASLLEAHLYVCKALRPSDDY